MGHPPCQRWGRFWHGSTRKPHQFTLGGVVAMQAWFDKHDDTVRALISFPNHKPSAMVSIDDRALMFDGTWPRVDDLRKFQPWNKRVSGATGNHPQGKLNGDDQGGLRMAIAADPRNGVVRDGVRRSHPDGPS